MNIDSELLENCAFESTVRDAITTLNGYAAANFGGFLLKLTGMVADKSEALYIRVHAANEIVRNLKKPSKFLCEIQKKKWLAVPVEEKEEIRGSLFKVLKALEHRDLIEPTVDILAQIHAFDLPECNCVAELIECFNSETSTVYTLTAAIKLLGDVTASGSTPIEFFHVLQDIFVIGLMKPEVGSDVNDYYSLNTTTFEAFGKIIEKLFQRTISPVVSQTENISSQYLVEVLELSKNLCKTVLGSWILKSDDDELCAAGVGFLTKNVSLHSSPNDYTLKHQFKLFWQGLMSTEMRTNFHIIISNAMKQKMKNASKSVKCFYSQLDLLA